MSTVDATRSKQESPAPARSEAGQPAPTTSTGKTVATTKAQTAPESGKHPTTADGYKPSAELREEKRPRSSRTGTLAARLLETWSEEEKSPAGPAPVLDHQVRAAAARGRFDSYLGEPGAKPDSGSLEQIDRGFEQARARKNETVTGLARELVDQGYRGKDAREEAIQSLKSREDLYATFDALHHGADRASRERLERIAPDLAALASNEEAARPVSGEQLRKEEAARPVSGETTDPVQPPKIDDPLVAPTRAARRAIRRRAQQDPSGFWLREAFEGKLTREQARELNRSFAQGDIPLPDRIEFTDPAELQGSRARYFHDRRGHEVLQVSRELKRDPAALQDAILEEFGHHVDRTVGGSDVRGDEGALFLEAVREGRVSRRTRRTEGVSEDRHRERIQGEWVSVENQGRPSHLHSFASGSGGEANHSIQTVSLRRTGGSFSAHAASGTLSRGQNSTPAETGAPARPTTETAPRPGSAPAAQPGAETAPRPGGAPAAQPGAETAPRPGSAPAPRLTTPASSSADTPSYGAPRYSTSAPAQASALPAVDALQVQQVAYGLSSMGDSLEWLRQLDALRMYQDLFEGLPQTVQDFQDLTDLLASAGKLPANLEELDRLPASLSSLEGSRETLLRLPSVLEEAERLKRSLDRVPQGPAKSPSGLGEMVRELAQRSQGPQTLERLTSVLRRARAQEPPAEPSPVRQDARAGVERLRSLSAQVQREPERLERLQWLGGLMREAVDRPDSLLGLARMPGLASWMDESLGPEQLKSLLRTVRDNPRVLEGLDRMTGLLKALQERPELFCKLEQAESAAGSLRGLRQSAAASPSLPAREHLEVLDGLAATLKASRQRPELLTALVRELDGKPVVAAPSPEPADLEPFELLSKVLTARRAETRVPRGIPSARAALPTAGRTPASEGRTPASGGPTPPPAVPATSSRHAINGPLGARRLRDFRHAYDLLRDVTIGKSTHKHAGSLAQMARRSDSVHAVADALEAVVVGRPGRMQEVLNKMTASESGTLAFGTTLSEVAQATPERLIGTLLLTADAPGGTQALADLFSAMTRKPDSSLTFADLLEAATRSERAARGTGELLDMLTAYDSQGQWDRSRQMALSLAEATRYVRGSRQIGQALLNSLEAEGGARSLSQLISRTTRTREGARATVETLMNLSFDREGSEKLATTLSRATASRAGSRDVLAGLDRIAGSENGRRQLSGLFLRLADTRTGGRLLANLAQDVPLAGELNQLLSKLGTSEIGRDRLGRALDLLGSSAKAAPDVEQLSRRAMQHGELHSTLNSLRGDESEAPTYRVRIRGLGSSWVIGENGAALRLPDRWELPAQAPPAPAPAPAPFRPGDVYSNDTLRMARICPECGSRTTAAGECPHCTAASLSRPAERAS